MGRLAKPQTVVTGFVREQLREMLIALDPMLSKATGVATRTHQTACRVKNGVAAEANQ